MAVEEEGLRVFQSVKIKIGEFWREALLRETTFLILTGIKRSRSVSIVRIICGFSYKYTQMYVQ